MINDLIKNIINDTIPLSRALTMAKVIAYKVKSEELKSWLSNEINGYSTQELPSYRKLHCDLYAEFYNSHGVLETIPCDMSEVIDLEETEYSFNEMRVVQDIKTIEFGLEQSKGEMFGYEYFPDKLVKQLQIVNNAVVTKIKRRIQFSQLKYIIEITKQKLLDTLLELNDTFPNLENEYVMNKENSEKVNNIVTTYITGNNNPLNISTGLNVEIKSTSVFNFSDNDSKYLESIGVHEKEIAEFKDIVSDENEDQNSKKSRIMKWLGNVSASIASRGLYESIPQLTDYIHRMFP